MRLYHRTSVEVMRSIMSDGAKDGRGSYLTDREHVGFWLADQPLDENEGAFGPCVLEYEIPETKVSSYEWIEEGKGYREFLVPAEVVNGYGPPKVRQGDVDLP